MQTERLTQLDANVDDIDPRLVPHAIDRLLDAGARDAWVTPILMKKGRPGFAVSALCDDDHLDAVRRTFFDETTTIGVRETRVDRHALEREMSSVDVGGEPIGVKVARLGEEIVNISVEWDDVERAALATGRPAIEILHEATAAAHTSRS